MYIICPFVFYLAENRRSITNSNWLMFSEIIGVHCENHRKYTNRGSNGKQVVYIETTLL
jgi:hypothetical protein